MDLTKLNFKENFQLFKSALNQSDFIAIDAEFSGLYNKLKLNPLDEFGDRYEILRKNLKQYVLLQVGICCFELLTPGEYKCYPFNFNIFPYSHEQSKDFNTAFLCDSNTLTFLADNKFDFNKVIYSGIPYISMMNLKSLIRQTKPLLSPTPTPALSRELELINRCIYSQIGEHEHTKERVLSTEEPILSADQPDLELTADTNETESNFDNLVIMTSFNQILQLVSQSNKRTVFHNGFLDLFHIMNQFYGPLPEKWDDFKSMVHSFFPKIFDTKYLACIDPFRDHIDQSSLATVYELFSAKFPLNITFPPQFDRYTPGGIEYKHEAGYDAMMTGHIFGSMLLLGVKIDKFVNEIFLGMQGVFHFSPTKRDIRPQRDNVLHFSTKSPRDKISKEEITDLLSPFTRVNNFWYHNNSVFVMLQKSLRKVDLLNFRTSCVHTKYHIMSYEEYYNAKRKIGYYEPEPNTKRNKNSVNKQQQTPKFHSKYSVESSNGNKSVNTDTQTVFPNVDDWDP
ncbi:Poly(A)-specific ribonuclease PARN-like [Oopsacas minuta]|uniref:Poly(A)-specific ribonuclease PARN-like n=1 Tax=Oopsacas minuta TaxID=111878 RepID=A0AAV7KG65_9METZ|nr:Poly(A)-specific ribonuclease PARN-like [Oopsacas minuta]